MRSLFHVVIIFTLLQSNIGHTQYQSYVPTTAWEQCIQDVTDLGLLYSGETNPNHSYYRSTFYWGPLENFDDGNGNTGVDAKGYLVGVGESLPGMQIGFCRHVGAGSTPTQSFYKSDVSRPDDTHTNQCASASGSIINMKSQTVIESIPIDGTNLILNYNSDYNSNTATGRSFKLLYSLPVYNSPYSFSVDVRDPTTNPATLLYEELEIDEQDERFYVWDGTSGVAYDNSFVKGISLRFTLATYIQSSSNGMYGQYCRWLLQPTEQDPNAMVQDCLPYASTKVDLHNENRSLIIYKPTVWGLHGWTLANHHYFDRTSKTLFDGNTDGRIPYHSFKTVQDSTYGTVDLVVDKNGAELLYIFDQQGRHLETRHAQMGHTLYKFTYDLQNQLVEVTDRFNKVVTISRDINGDLIKITSPYGVETNFTVASGDITTATNSLGKNYEMVYDSDKLLTEFQHPDGIETVFEYDTNGALIGEEKNNGFIQTFSKAFGRIDNFSLTEFGSRIRHLIGAGAKEAFLFVRNYKMHKFDGNDDQIYTRLRDGSWRYTTYGVSSDTTVIEWLSTSETWDKDHMYVSEQTTTSTEASQDIEQIVYISDTRTYSNSENPLTIQTTTLGNTINSEIGTTTINTNQKTILIQPAHSYATKFFYNTSGAMTRVETSTGTPVDLTYNNDGQLTRVQQGSAYQDYAYNQYGYLSTITTSDSRVTSFIRDLQGNVLTQTLPNGDQILFEYSDGGEIKKITTPSGGIHNFQMSIGDYLTQYLDAGSEATVFTYDTDKRLSTVTKPSGKTLEYTYAANTGHLNKIETNNGDYDYLNYDSRGRVGAILSPDNVRVEFQWLLGSLQQQKWYDTDGSPLATLSYNYQNNHIRIDEVKLNDNAISEITYDAQKGRIQQINNTSYTYSLQPDPTFAFVLSTNTQGFSTTHTWNNSNADSPVQTVTASAFENINLLLGITLKREYNNFGNTTSASSRLMDSYQGFLHSASELKPTYDANSRLIRAERIKGEYIDPNEVFTTEFFNRYNYTDDANNNVEDFIRSLTATGTPTSQSTATYSVDDRLLTISGAVSRDYTYTDDGDLLTMTDSSGTTTYNYDVFSNLKSVTLPNSDVITYKVDGLNRRVKKLLNGNVIEYYLWYDQIRLAAVLDANKAPKLIYIYGPESQHSPSFVIKNSVSYRILHDPGLGSIRYIVEPSSREIVQAITYDEYGNMMTNTDPTFQPLTFAGGLYDADTKLIRFGARDYDPVVGRWTTKDPIGFAGGDTNLYAYCHGNPMSCIDPEGEAGLIGAVVGIGFELAIQAYALEASGQDIYNYENYDWTDVGISGIFGAFAPGLMNVAKTTRTSVGAIRTLSSQIKKAQSINKVAKLQSRVLKNQNRIKDIITTQATFQGLKYGAKEANHMMCK